MALLNKLLHQIAIPSEVSEHPPRPSSQVPASGESQKSVLVGQDELVALSEARHMTKLRREHQPPTITEADNVL